MPTLEDFNEVLESLFKGGTRYRSEKIAVISVYLFIVGASFLWAFSEIELRSELEGEFESQKLENLEEKDFVLTNVSNSVWHDVRVVINGRYLAKLPKVKSDEARQLHPKDFEYFYFVPRPWGGKQWERVGGRPKPKAVAPADVEVEDVTIHCREGRVAVERNPDS